MLRKRSETLPLWPTLPSKGGPTIFALAAAAWVLSLAPGALGYCPARSCDPDAENGDECRIDPDSQCSVEGVALRRASGCITFAVQKGTAASVPGLSDADLEAAILDAFRQWTNVDCGEGPPGLRVQSAGVVEARDSFACTSVPEQNLDLWLLSDDLPSPQVVQTTTGAIAGTTYPSFILETGEVFDADVKLNTLWLLVQSESTLLEHLRAVATHEAGHALGLAHSQATEALMYKNYTVTEGYALSADDIRGICEQYPPRDVTCEEPSVPAAALSQSECNEAYLQLQGDPPPNNSSGGSTASGCGVSAASRDRGWSLHALLAFVVSCWCLRGRSRRSGQGRKPW